MDKCGLGSYRMKKSIINVNFYSGEKAVVPEDVLKLVQKDMIEYPVEQMIIVTMNKDKRGSLNYYSSTMATSTLIGIMEMVKMSIHNNLEKE